MMHGKYVGLIPVPVVLASLMILILVVYPEQNLPRSLVFELPSPFSSAHSLFLSVSALIVAYFFARSFLSGGSLNLVALGNGSLVLGLGFLLSQMLGNAPFGGPNELVGISSLEFLLAGAFFGAFSTLNLLGKTMQFGRPIVTLLVNYAGSIALVFVLIALVETKLLPNFFIPGVGPTLFRAEVLGASLMLFSYSSIVLIRDYSRSHALILYWFSLALALVAVGFLSALLGRVPGGPFSWLGRIALAVGGIYFIVSILEAYRLKNHEQVKRPEPQLRIAQPR